MAKQKRRNLLISLSVALALVIAVCGFGAYANTSNGDAIVFSNEVTTENTTKGKIDQIQYAINETGNLELLAVNSDIGQTGLGTLLPAYYSENAPVLSTEETSLKISDNVTYKAKLWKSPNVFGAIDDVVCVKNVSENTADALYIRTTFAFECGELTLDRFLELFHFNRNDTNWKWSGWISNNNNGIDINNEKYYIIYAEYIGTNPLTEKTLAAIGQNAITEPSLIQFALDKAAAKEDVVSLRDGGYKVLVSSQGATVETEFGTISAASHPWSGETTDTTN